MCSEQCDLYIPRHSLKEESVVYIGTEVPYYLLLIAVYAPVYAVYAINSLDTDSSLIHRTRCIMPRRRDRHRSPNHGRQHLDGLQGGSAARPPHAAAHFAHALCARQPDDGAVAGGPQGDDLCQRLLLGLREGRVAPSRRRHLHERRGLRRRLHAQPDVRGGLLGQDGPH